MLTAPALPPLRQCQPGAGGYPAAPPRPPPPAEQEEEEELSPPPAAPTASIIFMHLVWQLPDGLTCYDINTWAFNQATAAALQDAAAATSMPITLLTGACSGPAPVRHRRALDGRQL
jgi:hypothetical protein